MADHVGACTAALLPLYELIKAHVLAAERIHGDDTTVPVLAELQTRIGRLPWRRINRSIRPRLTPRSRSSAWIRGLPYRPRLSRWTRLTSLSKSRFAIERSLSGRVRQA
jgi:hypothetical protein